MNNIMTEHDLSFRVMVLVVFIITKVKTSGMSGAYSSFTVYL